MTSSQWFQDCSWIAFSFGRVAAPLWQQPVGSTCLKSSDAQSKHVGANLANERAFRSSFAVRCVVVTGIVSAARLKQKRCSHTRVALQAGWNKGTKPSLFGTSELKRGEPNLIKHFKNRLAARVEPQVQVEIERRQQQVTTLDETLHPEQAAVAAAVLNGRNVFFTGMPGSGKSYVMKTIIKLLRLQKGSGSVVVCAATGVAALNVGGVTLHSAVGWTMFGWFLAGEARKRILQARVLLIDEISMISGQFLDEVSLQLSRVRGNTAPFGGLQVVLSGDFMQLPPVEGDTMAFEALAWKDLRLLSIELQENHRQAGDPAFQALLRQVRYGEFPDDLVKRAQQVSYSYSSDDEKVMPLLVSTNAEANSLNSSHLRALTGESREFKAKDSPTSATEALNQGLIVQPLLTLKIGAHVVLLKNLDVESKTPLVNGSTGVVVGFGEGRGGYPIVEFAQGVTLSMPPREFVKEYQGRYCYRRQVPLKLAWALTIHKSQGMTLDKGTVQLDRAFDIAQIYVALSRFKSLDAIMLLGMPDHIFSGEGAMMRKKAMAFHKKVAATSDQEE